MSVSASGGPCCNKNVASNPTSRGGDEPSTKYPNEVELIGAVLFSFESATRCAGKDSSKINQRKKG
jgi:hypothetical protein